VKARFVSTAELELKEAMEFYEAAREGLGAEFLAEVEATTNLIESFPLAWTFIVSAAPTVSLTACFIKCDATKF
jgi:hypothetical protein